MQYKIFRDQKYCEVKNFGGQKFLRVKSFGLTNIAPFYSIYRGVPLKNILFNKQTFDFQKIL